MSAVRFKTYLVDSTVTIKTLLILLFLSTSVLSTKAAHDLNKYIDTFPAWFVPGFSFGIIVLISVCLYFVWQARKVHGKFDLIAPRKAVYLWLLMILSFIATTSVHGFYPFRFDILSVFAATDSVLRFNYLIAAVGLATSTILAGMYIFSQWKVPAVLGLLGMSLLLLIPNDRCTNQFNIWWIANVGASPLMYVPNLYAAFFVTCGMFGIHSKAVAWFTLGICFASLLLGLGHQFRILW